MKMIYALFHTATGDVFDQDRCIGVFAERTSAHTAMTFLAGKPGFVGEPEGFIIDAYEVDEDNWKEGFAWNDERPDADGSDLPELGIVAVDENPDVFMLEHRRVVGIHDMKCLIGFYSSASNAQAAALRVSSKPGFRSFVDGFAILGLRIDRQHWSDGFADAEVRRHWLLSRSPPT